MLSTDAGGGCLPYALDIRNENEVAALGEELKERYGRVNFLINNAGQGIFKPLPDITVDEWNLMHETMVLGSFLCTKYLLPLILDAENPRHILINSSFWGQQGCVANCSAYNSAKFAQRGLAQSLREELRRENVKVTCFLPASIDTPFFDGDFSWKHTPEKILSPEDLAEVVYDILHYPGNLVVEEITIQAVDPD
ncbi:MAG: SDR family oxidoreductase [Bacillota bacterium]